LHPALIGAEVRPPRGRAQQDAQDLIDAIVGARIPIGSDRPRIERRRTRALSG
jgi:hypothetical protein